MNTRLLFSLLASMVAASLPVHAENSTPFREPTAQGLSPDKNPPLRIERIQWPVAPLALDANLQPRYAIESATWVWLPGARADQKTALLFVNDFELTEAREFVFHVSADQRYELSLDEQLIAFGPDRGDVAHWNFASYRVSVVPGQHRLSALVAWIGDDAPGFQAVQIAPSPGATTPLP